VYIAHVRDVFNCEDGIDRLSDPRHQTETPVLLRPVQQAILAFNMDKSDKDASISCGRDISCDTRMPAIPLVKPFGSTATRDPARPNRERWWGGKVTFDRAAPWPVVTAQYQRLLPLRRPKSPKLWDLLKVTKYQNH
jgi:hypothetical protein